MPQGNTTRLEWTVENEQELDHYEVEHRTNYTEYIKIGSVKAGRNNYMFTDRSPATTHNYYRLKMADRDGKFTYSKIERVSFLNNRSPLIFYPNPATSTIQIKGNNNIAAVTQIIIIDVWGKVLMKKVYQNFAAEKTIDIHELPSGTFLIKMLIDGKEYCDKLIVIK